MRLLLLVAALVIAGCADPAPVQEAEDDGLDVEVDDQTGAIRGVVVDQGIVPVAEAKVVLATVDPVRETVTDSEGRFAFSKVPPGAHELDVSKLAHEGVKASVVVVAGDAAPRAVRVQLVRLHDQQPFFNTQLYEGHVGCGFRIAGVSSTCVNDFTRLDPTGTCPGGCLRPITGIVDQREFKSAVEAGWESIVWELAWRSSTTGTASSLGLTVSYETRIGASHWYASRVMEQPFRMQVDVGVDGPGKSGGADPAQINPEGQDDLWNMISSGSELTVLQDVEVFQTNFYYAPSPEDWSIIGGSPPPF